MNMQSSGPLTLLMGGFRLVRRWGMAGFWCSASLLLPATFGLGLLAWLLLSPLFPVVLAWEAVPTQIFEALRPLQSHALTIYAGLFGGGVILLQGLVIPLTQVALLVGYSSLAIGERLVPLEAWYRLVPVLRLVVWTLWARAWRVVLGWGLLLLPGLILSLFYSQAELVTLLEGRSGPDALARSRRWMENTDALGRLIGVWLLLWLLGTGVGLLWHQLCLYLMGQPSHFLSWALRWVVPVVVMLPLHAAVGLLFYTDLQVRQQAFRRAFESAWEHQAESGQAPGILHWEGELPDGEALEPRLEDYNPAPPK